MNNYSESDLALVASPAGCFDAFSRLFDTGHPQSLANLDAYLTSWRTPDGLGGIIATWWSSAVDTVKAHPMNQAPVMLGAARLISAGVRGDWSSILKHEARGLAGQVDENGLLRNGWGDLPGRPLAPVIGFSAAGGLYAAAGATGIDSFRTTADSILGGYERAFSDGSSLYHGVANQAARWAITLLQRYYLLREAPDLERAVQIGDTILKEQVCSGPHVGAIYQGTNSDILITVYIGKCLYALLAIYRATGEVRFLDAAKALGRYLLSQHVGKDGLFLNAFEPKGAMYGIARRMGPVLRRLGVSPSYCARLRRATLRDWAENPYPVMIARASDSIRGLGALTEYAQDMRQQVQQLLEALVRQQSPNGGIPNSIGYSGAPQEPPPWQDKIVSTRWNAYVFQLLAELVAAGASRAELPASRISWSNTNTVCNPRSSVAPAHLQFYEDERTVRLEPEHGLAVWCIDKSTGKVKANDAWRGELTGARSIRQMALEARHDRQD